MSKNPTPPARSWEELIASAIENLEAADKALDDITGWSGGAGNWPAQEAHPRVRAALEALRARREGAS